MSKTPATVSPGIFPYSTPHLNMRPSSVAPQDGSYPAYSVTPQQHHQYLANLATSQMAVKRDLGKDFSVGAGYSGNASTSDLLKTLEILTNKSGQIWT